MYYRVAAFNGESWRWYSDITRDYGAAIEAADTFTDMHNWGAGFVAIMQCNNVAGLDNILEALNTQLAQDSRMPVTRAARVKAPSPPPDSGAGDHDTPYVPTLPTNQTELGRWLTVARRYWGKELGAKDKGGE